MKSNFRKIKGQIITACLITLILGLSIWGWEDILEDRLIPKRWGTIENGRLYRSGRLSSYLAEKTLNKYRIKVIVDLAGEEPGNQDEIAQKQAAQNLGIIVKRYPLRGNGTGDVSSYINALQAMIEVQRAGHAALIHCVSGTQRTGGVTACYRLLIENRSPDIAYAELKKYGWKLHKNPDLIEYVNRNLPVIAQALKQKGYIDTIPDPVPQLPVMDI